jgi:hypothetical protein
MISSNTLTDNNFTLIVSINNDNEVLEIMKQELINKQLIIEALLFYQTTKQ